MTHAALAYQWASDNGCIDKDSPLWRRLAGDICSAMEKMVQEKGVRDEVGCEAAAFLCYLGRESLLPAGIVRDVRAAQTASGAFQCASDEGPGVHYTVLCLWILLEAVHPEVPHVAMMPEDTPQPE